MENFKTESKYLKFCHDFRAVIRCMKAAFYRPDYQKTRSSICFKTCGRASKRLSRGSETLGQAFEGLREN